MRVSTVLVIASGVSAYAVGDKVVHEKRDTFADDWVKHSKPNPGDVLPVRIALRQRNLENAEQYIMDVADPSSPNFGKHWSAEKVAETFAPSEETYKHVVEWLESLGIVQYAHSAGRNWIQFNATVNELENILDTEYHTFKHEYHSREGLACDSYKIPTYLRDHIDFITPTVHFDNLERLRHRAIDTAEYPKPKHTAMDLPLDIETGHTGLTGLKKCGDIITIECLRAIYKFPPGKTSHKGNRMGIGEWHDYLYRPDLLFKRLTKPEIPSNTFPEFISIDGGKHANLSVALRGESIESALDFQVAYSIIYPQNLRLYQVGDSINVNSVGSFNIFLDALDASYCTYKGGDSRKHDPHYPDPKKGGYKGPLQCGGSPISNVISISYGQIEAALPAAYQHRQCHEYMKLGLMGVSILFASGDAGVANSPTSGVPNRCLAKHSTKRLANGTRFNPGFPNNCPYVTNVGATDLLHRKAKNGKKAIFRGERAVSDPSSKHPQFDYYSGGGFSNYFKMPTYQAKAVSHYLKTYPPPYGPDVFNKSGNARAYPDVSAIGLHVAIVYLGSTFGIGGTSASTPIVASIVNLLNEERLRAGKGPIGFLNPTFYANPHAFNDVTVGNNPGCGTKGFACQPGWDPVTGLGTPNFEKLRKVFLDLP